MNAAKQRILGLLLLIVVIGGTALALTLSGNGALLGFTTQDVVVKGYVGGEKIDFLADPDTVRLLSQKYHLTVDYAKAGSIEMTDMDLSGMDFLFPSSQTAYEIAKGKNIPKGQSEKVFYSPIVLYSWKPIVEALAQKGVVTAQDGHYTADFSKLLDLVINETSWNDLGVDIYGNIQIISTDPNKSNSGTMYSALLANMLGGGKVLDMAALPSAADKLRQVFQNLGQMEYSSSNLFSRYLNLGMGESPIIVGYESQMIEFAVSDPALWEKVRDRVALIYPAPTVWSEHYYISLSENGEGLLTALLDPEIQQIAWKKHGFRTASTAFGLDQEILETIGIKENIDQVMQVPSAETMIALLKEIQK